MKKILVALFLLAACVLTLAACNGSDNQDSSLSSQASSGSATAAPTAKPSASPTPKASATPKPTPKASATPKPTASPTPEPTPESSDPDDDQQIFIAPDPTPEPTPETTHEPDPEPQANPSDYIGSDINSFYSVFGYPNSSDYGPSCMGPGEDGLLYYSNFTVFTYREGDSETIQDIG